MRVSAAKVYDALTMRTEWRSNTHCSATDREKYMFRALLQWWSAASTSVYGALCFARWPFGRSVDRVRSAANTRSPRKRRNAWNETETIDETGVVLFVCFPILSHAFDAQARQVSQTSTHAHNFTVAAHCWTFSRTTSRSTMWWRFRFVELRRRAFNSSRYSRLACPLATAQKYLFLLMTSFCGRLYLFAVAVALRIYDFALKRNFPLADDVWVDWATRTPNEWTRKTIDKFKATNPTNADGKLLNHSPRSCSINILPPIIEIRSGKYGSFVPVLCWRINEKYLIRIASINRKIS